MKLIILSILFLILVLGYISLKRKYLKHQKKLEFGADFRNRFVTLANYYSGTYDSWSRSGNVDNDHYTWLTKNVDQMQADLGGFGIINYTAPFGRYNIPRYEILINTLPKFKERIHDSEINMSEGCLLRYIGVLESSIETDLKNLKNPFIWFKEGVSTLLILPLSILNWFDIINIRTVKNVTSNLIYKIVTGIIALITLISGIVTIIQGKEETVLFIKKLFHQ